MKIIEIVPNVSEGYHPDVIAKLRNSLEIPGIRVAHVDSCGSANRTVFTAFGSPAAVVRAAKSLIDTAREVIDLQQHTGAHPRIGAVDIFPFIPFEDATIDDATACAKELGHYAGGLGIPTILYELSASRNSQRELPSIRRGGLMAFSERLKSGELVPDFGPSIPHDTVGGLVTGARHPLVAYNIQLTTENVAIAKHIARALRHGSAAWSSYSLPATRAIGWYAPERACAEVSCNLLDYRITSLLAICNTVSKLAEDAGTSVRSSDIIGLVPRQALADCSRSGDLNDAIAVLGLNKVRPFCLPERLLEFQMSLGCYSPE